MTNVFGIRKYLGTYIIVCVWNYIFHVNIMFSLFIDYKNDKKNLYTIHENQVKNGVVNRSF